MLRTGKPDSVAAQGRVLSFIWPRRHQRGLAAYPSQLSEENNPRKAARQSGPGYTWHFNPQGLSLPDIAAGQRALLPHVFTLTPTNRGGIVSVTLSVSARGEPHPLDGVARYVVRTFLT